MHHPISSAALIADFANISNGIVNADYFQNKTASVLTHGQNKQDTTILPAGDPYYLCT